MLLEASGVVTRKQQLHGGGDVIKAMECSIGWPRAELKAALGELSSARQAPEDEEIAPGTRATVWGDRFADVTSRESWCWARFWETPLLSKRTLTRMRLNNARCWNGIPWSRICNHRWLILCIQGELPPACGGAPVCGCVCSGARVRDEGVWSV